MPVAAIVALMVSRLAIGRSDARAFIASSAYIASVIASVGAGLYPMLLPASAGSPNPGLDIYNAAAPHGSLRTAFVIYLTGVAIVSVYLVAVYRIWKGKSGQVYH